MTDVNLDQAIFDAIIAATKDQSLSCGQIVIDTKAFIDTFNGHRDRKLCTSLDVAQSPERCARIEQLEAALFPAKNALNAVRILMKNQDRREHEQQVYEAIQVCCGIVEAALEMSKPGVERMMAAVAQAPYDLKADVEAASKRVADEKMARVDASLATQLGRSIKLNAELSAEVTRLKTALKEADWLVQELAGHEGAEGWSEYLRLRLNAYTPMANLVHDTN